MLKKLPLNLLQKLKVGEIFKEGYYDKSKNQAFLLSNMYYWFTSYFIIGNTSKTVKYTLFSRMEVFRFLDTESLKIEVMKNRLWF